MHLWTYQPGHDHVADLIHAAGVTLVEVDKGSQFDPRVLVHLIRYARHVRFDVGVAFLPTPSTYAVLAARLAGGFPVVVSERSFFEGHVSLEDRLRRQPHRLAAHVTANSHHQRERLVLEFPWMAGRISTIWNGVDTQAFHPRPEAETPRAEGSLRVLGVGSVLPVKEIPLLAQALVRLAERRGPAAEVRWAGEDRLPESHAVQEQVRALLEPRGLLGRWHWLGLRKDVAELHHASDLLVHPSATEGLANAICEALASGLPVVTTRAGDHPRLVADGEAGFLFSPARADELADALARIAALPPAQRAAMGRRARSFAERELSREAYVTRYEALLRSLVRDRAAVSQRRARTE